MYSVQDNAHSALVAQLVRVTVNREVTGSIPVRSV